MNKTTFGKTNRQVSRLGFGAWAIGSRGYGKVERNEAFAALESYVKGGGNFIDTARGYGNSEEILGEFIQTHGLRDQLFICSKTAKLEKDAIYRDVESTLKNLGCDSIDLYYLHSPPDDVDQMNEVLDVFSSLKQSSQLRAIGASIKGPSVTSDTQSLCRQYIQSGRIDAIQLIYSIFRQSNRLIFEEAQSAGVALVGRTALESGFLTGKYKPSFVFPEKDHRLRWKEGKLNAVLEEVLRLKTEPTFEQFDNLAQMALRFASDEDMLSTVIVGARNREQIEAHLNAIEKSGLPTSWRHALIEKYAEGNTLGNL